MGIPAEKKRIHAQPAAYVKIEQYKMNGIHRWSFLNF
jgi:hypothetical protein